MNAQPRQTEGDTQIDSWVHSCRAALAGTLEEPVLAACPCTYGGSSRVVLVITPTSLRAYATAAMHTNELDPSRALAVWPRASVSVTSAHTGGFTLITLAAADRQPIAVQAPKNPNTDRFIALLQNGAAR